MGILHVTTLTLRLTLRLHPNLRHEKGSKLGGCHKMQMHSHKHENVQGRESQHS